MKNLLLTLLALSLPVVSMAQKKKNKSAPIALSIPTLKLELVRELNLEKTLQKDRGAFVSAASGLVKVKDTFYLVADDEASLFSFQANSKYLTPHPLLTLDLPADNVKRKALKPDFESLAYLDEKQWPPYGALVAWPSASTIQRMKAVTLPFDKNAKLEAPIVSDILALAYRLQSDAKDLNMEGLLIRDDKVFMFQRGNSSKGKNGFGEMSLASWLKGLKENNWAGKLKFEPTKIGSLSGVELTITDAAWSQYGLLVLASAEDTQSTYADGMIYGSVLARLMDNKIEILAKFDPINKLEGLAVEHTTDGLDLYLVEDADDAEKAGRLYRVAVPTSILHAVTK